MSNSVKPTRARLSIVAVALVALVSIATGSAILISGASAEKDRTFEEARAAGAAAGAAVAARVGDREIPLREIEMAIVFMRNQPEPPDLDLTDPRAVVEVFVRTEVMFQEAERRGLLPTDSEVHAAVLEQQAALQAAPSDPGGPGALKAWAGELKGTPFDIDLYDSSDEVHKVYRQTLAVGLLSQTVLAEFPDIDPRDRPARERVLDEFYEKLLAEADVEVFVN